MKKAVIFALCLLLCVALPLSVAAADFDYSGELDITGEKPSGSGGGSGQGGSTSADRVSLGNGASYDLKTKKYYYAVAQTEVALNVPDGIITTAAVSVEFPEGLVGQIYRDGEIATQPPTELTEPGNYVVRFSEDVSSSVSVKFSIVNKTTGALTGYHAPDGFVISEAKFNDEPIECAGYVDMTDEGKYQVVIRSRKTNVVHSLTVIIDHTAPTLALEAVVDGYAKGPVDISDVDADTRMTVYLNGKPIDAGRTLTKAGTYKIELQDKAGNKSVYSFVIQIYFNTSGIAFIIMVVIGVTLLIVYLRIKRKRLRIR